MNTIALHSSLVASLLFFIMVRREMHQSKKIPIKIPTTYYPN